MKTTAQDIKKEIAKMIEGLDTLCGDYQFACPENTEEITYLREEAIVSLDAIDDFIDADVKAKADGL